jgi:hypothetical protein
MCDKGKEGARELRRKKKGRFAWRFLLSCSSCRGARVGETVSISCMRTGKGRGEEGREEERKARRWNAFSKLSSPYLIFEHNCVCS